MYEEKNWYLISTHCSSWTLEDSNLSFPLLQDFIYGTHELFLDIIRRIRMVEVNLLDFFGKLLHNESWLLGS